jgi:hypothetical protein
MLSHQCGGRVRRHRENYHARRDSNRVRRAFHFDRERAVIAPFDALGCRRQANGIHGARERVGEGLHAASK